MSATYWKLAWSRVGEPDRVLGIFMDQARAEFRAGEAILGAIKDGYVVRVRKQGRSWVVVRDGQVKQFLELVELGFDR